LTDGQEAEGELVKASLSNLLLGRVCKLHFKSCEEVEVGVLDVVVDRVELFKSFEDLFDPPIYLGAFDECKRYGNMPYWGFEAWHSLVCHHVNPELSYKHVGVCSISIEEEGGNACRFQVCYVLDGNEMSGGYSP